MEDIYHLDGYNKKALLFFHHLTDEPVFFNIMKLSSAYIGNYLWAPVTIPIIILIALSTLKKKSKDKTSICINMIQAFIVMFISLFIAGILVKVLKSYSEMPRPYCSLDASLIRDFVVHKTAKCFRSFPSGHTAYTAAIVFSLWPIMSSLTKYIASIVLVLVCISRLSMAMHYPADVIGSLILTTIIVFTVRKLTEHHVNRLKTRLVSVCNCLTK